jgi:acyl-coenzyme A synthetase/AMP-(fatty) acid ligase
MKDFYSPVNNITERAHRHLPAKKDDIAFIFPFFKLTFSEATVLIQNLQVQLKNQLLKKNDKVLILAPLNPELIFALLSLLASGVIPVLIDPRLDRKLWKTSIQESNPDYIITTAKLINFHWLLPWTWRFKFISLDKKTLGADFINFKYSVSNKTHQSLINFGLCTTSSTDEVIFTLTSGTTGKPKMISRSFAKLESQQRLSCKYLPKLDTDVHLSLYNIGILQSFIHGATTVVITDFSPKNILAALITHKVTRLSIPPGLLFDLIVYLKHEKTNLPYLKCILTGGAPIPSWFRNLAKDFFNTSDVFIVYGSTECEPISKLNLTDFKDCDYIGYPVGKIIDELQIHKKLKFKYKQQEIFEISLSGENCVFEKDSTSLNIGDLASFDNSGNIWLLGRNTECVCGIPAALIEEQIERFPGIKRALVLEVDQMIYLFIEPLTQILTETIASLIHSLFSNLVADFGPVKYHTFKVDKLPVDSRHFWKLQRKQVSTLLKYYCRDRLF